MSETAAANQAREMQSRTAKQGKADEVKKDDDGNIVGSNITADGKDIPRVQAVEPPGLVQSGLQGGVGIYGSGQDQDGEEVEAKGKEENEKRKAANDEAVEKAEGEQAEAQDAAKAASEEARKPASEKAKGKK